MSWNKEGLPGPRGLAGVAGQPGANGTKGERGEQGPQGPGAISFDTTIPGESPAEPRRLAGPVDGIEVSVVCNSASKEVFVSVGVTSGKNSLQAAGTDSAGPTGSPVTSLDSTGGASVLKHDGFSADLDVVVADSTIGKTVHVDVHGEYGEPSCRAWGIAIPAS